VTVINKAKENPLMAGLLTLGAIAVAVTSIWQGAVLLDKSHTTEAELLIYDLKAHTFASQQFSDLAIELNKLETIGKCRWLSSEIRALKDGIYVRTRDGADPDYLQSLKVDLEELEDDYDALECARKLA